MDAEQFAAFENTLVAQKDEIIRRINACSCVEMLEEVSRTLPLLESMWFVVGYGYKTKEMIKRIAEKAETMRHEEMLHLAQSRRNAKDRTQTEANIRRLSMLV